MPFVSFAQNAEDLMLWRALHHVERGFWIDAGAADPDDMSVTRAFHDRGWTGVNVEPSTHYFDRLRLRRPGDVNLRVALGAQSGSRPFHVIEDTGLSTLDEEIARTHARAGFVVTTGAVEVCTLAEICRWHVHGPIHFLKVDVEGAEAELLAGADWRHYRPWIVLVEATVPLSDEPTEHSWEPILLAADYCFVWFDGLNRFYVAREHEAALAPAFRLPPNLTDDWRAAADQERVERLSALEAEAIALETRLGRAALELATQRAAAASALAGRDEARGERDAVLAEAAWLRRSLDALRDAAPPPTLPPPTPVPVPDPPPAASPPVQLALPPPAGRRRIAARVALPLWRLVRPFARPLAWRIRTFLTAELRAELGQVLEQVRPADKPREPDVFDRHRGSSAEPLRLPAPDIGDDRRRAPFRHAVHQFHPSIAPGDAITNGLLLTRTLLRRLGFDSEIYVRHRGAMTPGDARLLADLPTHDGYVLMVHHSLGDPQADAIAGLPAPKVLVYHNITPPELLDDPALQALAVLGREQLDFWRPLVVAAIAISDYNAIELRQAGFPVVATSQLLFDVERLKRDAARARLEHRTDAPLTILFVGRIVASKGQADLVDAYAAFRSAFADRESRLVLVGRAFGSEAYDAEVRQRIARHGLQSSVILTGGIDDDALQGWYACADIYASMSLHEGFGVPLVEAMAHGLPIVARAAGAVASTLGDAGILVENTGQMADALLALAGGRACGTAPARAARLDSFRLDRQFPALLELLAAAGAVRPASTDRDALKQTLTLTVAGHIDGSYSLAAVNRAMALSLDAAAPHRVGLLPVEGEPRSRLAFGSDAPDGQRLRQLAERERSWTGAQAVISQHYPVWVPPTRAGQLRFAFLFWEESLLPDVTVDTLNAEFDGVLAPSQFVATALVDSGVTTPVRIVGFAPSLDRFAVLAGRPERGHERPFTFLHVSSGFPRKGVDILLGAFARAFAPGENVRLVVKTFPNPHNDVRARIDELQIRHPGVGEIVHIDRDLTADELDTLYLGADAIVLPSRGEGFNIPAAEAIAAGVPLIVSAVGGHRDFIGADMAILVGGRLGPSGSHLASDGSLWFEPDADALTDAMRDVLDHSEAATARAGRARDILLSRLDPAHFARRVLDAVAGLLGAPGPAAEPARIAMMTTWGVRCGVAEYAAMLVGALPPTGAALTILADERCDPQDGRPAVRQAWQGGERFSADEAASVISSTDPDILLIQHQPGLFSWSALADLLDDPRVHRRTVTVTLHNTRSLDGLEPADRTRLARAFGRVERLIVHAPADADRLRGMGATAVTTIPQGTPAPRTAPKPTRSLLATDAPVIGAYGFLLPPKNFGSLIEALPILRRSWPRATLRMVTALYDQGPSETEHHRLRRLAHEIGVGGEIDWHTGFLPTTTSLELLGDCDLLVLPYEPTPEASSAALRTALASLVPTAVTPIDIFREAGPAVARLPGGNAKDIAAGVAMLLQDTDARRALVDRQQAWLAGRSWQTVARRTLRLVTALHAQRARPDGRAHPLDEDA